MIPIHVVSVSRNAGEFTRQHLESLLSQDYGNFRITWVDDCSEPPDRAVGVAIELLEAHPQHRIIQRQYRHGGLFNVYQTQMTTPAGEVVFPVGGDDHLTRPDALSIIAAKYEDTECWFTHGASWFIGPNGGAGTFASAALHDDFRNHPFYWLPSSWRSELTHKVDPQDLQLGGWWFMTAGDVALYTPILEMCGIDRLRYIEETIYFYRAHDHNDGRLSTRFQEFCGWEARCKPRYSRLKNLQDTPTRTPHTMPVGLAFPPQLNHGIRVRCTMNGDQVTIGPE